MSLPSRIEQLLATVFNAWLESIRLYHQWLIHHDFGRGGRFYGTMPPRLSRPPRHGIRRSGEMPAHVVLILDTVISEPADAAGYGENYAAQVRKTITICNICECTTEPRWPVRAVVMNSTQKAEHLLKHATRLWPLEHLLVWADACGERKPAFEGLPMDAMYPIPIEWFPKPPEPSK